MEQLVQPFYRHLNMMEESNSNAPTYSGTRREERRGRGLCIRRTASTLRNHYHLDLYPSHPSSSPPTLSPRADMRRWLSEWGSLPLFHPFILSSVEGVQLFTCPLLVWWPAVLWGQSVWAWLWRWGVCQNLGARSLSGGLAPRCRGEAFLPDQAEMLC